MKFLTKLTPAFVALFMAAAPLFAQNTLLTAKPTADEITRTVSKDFTDATPSFRQWQPAYSVTKIDYTANEMVVHFQYNEVYSSHITLHQIGSDQAFVLRDKNGVVYQPTAIRNVRNGGELLHADISKETVSFSTEGSKSATCEIVFPRLPQSVTQADLIEGVNYLTYGNHFHVFDIAISNKKEDIKSQQIVLPVVEELVDIEFYDEPQELGGMSYREVEDLENIEDPEFIEDIDWSEFEEPEYVSGKTTATQLTDLVKEVKKPSYKKHNDQCTIDNIQYREKEMVITFTYHDGFYPSATFYGPEGAHAWFLKDKNGNTYPMRALNNLRMNDNTVLAEGISTEVVVSNEIEVDYNNYNDKTKNRYTCEIVFDRLPQGVKIVDLIEGVGREAWDNHFNAFNIKIKQFNTPVVVEEPAIEPAIEPVVEPIVGQATERNNFAVAESANYTLFPNPNQGSFFLTNNGASQEKAMIQVLDLSGKLLFSQQATIQENATQGFKVDNLVAGQYLVRITNGDKTTETLKMIVVE